MAATVPDEPIGDDGHMMGGALPLPHQNGPRPCRSRCPARPGRVCEHASEQSVNFPCRCFAHATVSAFLPIVDDAKRQKLAAEGPRYLARRKVCSVLAPVDPDDSGIVHFNSSPVKETLVRFCSLPSNAGKVLPSTFKVTTLSAAV